MSCWRVHSIIFCNSQWSFLVPQKGSKQKRSVINVKLKNESQPINLPYLKYQVPFNYSQQYKQVAICNLLFRVYGNIILQTNYGPFLQQLGLKRTKNHNQGQQSVTLSQLFILLYLTKKFQEVNNAPLCQILLSNLRCQILTWLRQQAASTVVMREGNMEQVGRSMVQIPGQEIFSSQNLLNVHHIQAALFNKSIKTSIHIEVSTQRYNAYTGWRMHECKMGLDTSITSAMSFIE